MAVEKTQRIPTTDLTQRLLDTLGERLTTVIAGEQSAETVRHWAQGKNTPSPEVRSRLENTLDVVQVIEEAYPDQMMRVWFTGSNEFLEGRSPALALADTPQQVLEAANAEVWGSYA